MSRYRTRETASESEPFAGLSIGKQIRSSAYGMFVDALADIESIIPAADFKLELPRVVVVGERSVGKSSLLENFTKCPIFPRGKGTCTKMPVRLQLQRVDSIPEHVATVCHGDQPVINLNSTAEILGAVQAIMNDAEGITSEEITVVLRQVDGVTFTFVDLPGIQQWPSADHETSKNLVTSYLTDTSQDTLVLCVIDANTAADLERSAALKEITAAGKISKTILALTKCDEVTDVDAILDKIFDPLADFNSGNIQIPDLVGLAGCVATANRKTHGCPLSLKDFDAMEQGIFETMITKASAPCPSMPDDFKVQLANHMTIQQLIIKLDQLYRTFIVKHWKPKALARMAPKVADTWAALTHLGPDVDTLETGHVLQHLNEQVDFESLCRTIANLDIEVTPGCQLRAWRSKVGKHTWGTAGWAKATAQTQAAISQAINQTLNCGGTHLAVVTAAYVEAFAKDSPMKLHRFASLRSAVLFTLLPQVVKQAMAAAIPVIQRMQQQAFDDMYCDDAKHTFVKLSKGIQGCITERLFNALQEQLQLPFDFALEEEQSVALRRASLQQQLSRLKAAQSSINNIQKAVSAETTLQDGSVTTPDSDNDSDISDSSIFYDSSIVDDSSNLSGNSNSKGNSKDDSQHASVPDSPPSLCNGKLVAAAADMVHKSTMVLPAAGTAITSAAATIQSALTALLKSTTLASAACALEPPTDQCEAGITGIRTTKTGADVIAECHASWRPWWYGLHTGNLGTFAAATEGFRGSMTPSDTHWSGLGNLSSAVPASSQHNKGHKANKGSGITNQQSLIKTIMRRPVIIMIGWMLAVCTGLLMAYLVGVIMTDQTDADTLHLAALKWVWSASKPESAACTCCPWDSNSAYSGSRAGSGQTLSLWQRLVMIANGEDFSYSTR